MKEILSRHLHLDYFWIRFTFTITLDSLARRVTLRSSMVASPQWNSIQTLDLKRDKTNE
jgi:hypothetical protein